MGDVEKKSEEFLGVEADHAELVALFGLDKGARSHRKVNSVQRRPGLRSFVSIGIGFLVIASSVAAYVYANDALERREQDFLAQEKADELAREEARRLRIEYAEIAFIDSLPPLAAISLDGKPLYAKTDDGSYTEFRARASSWLRNLPVREDTVYAFTFSAEGFKPLTRRIAYYDWYPTQSEGHSLQKVFRKVVMEPDVSPRLSYCGDLDATACDWTVFREIMFREAYIERAKQLILSDEASKRVALASYLRIHPDVELGSNDSRAAQEMLWAVEQRAKAPYALYGRISLTSDTADTRVFFMGEPLMVLKENGSSAQVRLHPGTSYTFDSTGQGRPIDIGQKLSLRLESKDMSYVTEIHPHQWHCTALMLEQAQTIDVPPFVDLENAPDLRHYLCDYSVSIDVSFDLLKAQSEEREGLDKQEGVAKPVMGGGVP